MQIFIGSQHSVLFCSVLATCLSNSVNCRAANYWYSGFIRLQSVIDAAIIQVRWKTVLCCCFAPILRNSFHIL